MVRSSDREGLAPFAMSNQWGGFSQMKLFSHAKIFWELWYLMVRSWEMSN